MKIKRTMVLAALALACMAGPAEAVTLKLNNGMTVRYDFGNTECSIVEMTGYGVGLATAMPVVRAINATRYRDVQNVTVRTDLHKFNPATKQFELAARGDEFRGLAADDNYVVSFQNLRTGAAQLVRERLLWQLTTNGFYRVAQYITWHQNGRVPSFTRKAWLFHSPGPRNQFCFIQ